MTSVVALSSSASEFLLDATGTPVVFVFLGCVLEDKELPGDGVLENLRVRVDEALIDIVDSVCQGQFLVGVMGVGATALGGGAIGGGIFSGLVGYTWLLVPSDGRPTMQ